jgi:hypothetical protein
MGRHLNVSSKIRLIEAAMEALLETLDAKLGQWKPETATEVRARVSEIIGLADQDALDLLRSRTCSLALV